MKIRKKYLFYIFLIGSLISNIYLYTREIKTEQEAAAIANELVQKNDEISALKNTMTEKDNELTTVSNSLIEKEEEVTVLQAELAEEKDKNQPQTYAETAMIAGLAAADYLETSQTINVIHTAVLDKLVKDYHLYDDADYNYPNLIDTALISMENGEQRELFIIRHDDKSEKEKVEIENIGYSASAYSLILVNYESGTDELLFQTGNHGITSLEQVISYWEYFDMEIVDIDGNGEEDVILLIGGHAAYSNHPDVPEMFCLIGLQKGNEFYFLSTDEEAWLREIINPLYEIENENRKIAMCMDGLKQHFGNWQETSEQINNTSTEIDMQLEEYITFKNERMSAQVFDKSLYFEQELLWETYIYDESEHVKKLKIYKEHGERGNTNCQIVLYLYDYTTEDVEKQDISELFAAISEEEPAFIDVTLRDVFYEDFNDDGNLDIRMAIAGIFEDGSGRECEELYEITYYYQSESGQFICERTD